MRGVATVEMLELLANASVRNPFFDTDRVSMASAR